MTEFVISINHPILSDEQWLQLRREGRLADFYEDWLNTPLTTEDLNRLYPHLQKHSPLAYFNGMHQPTEQAWARRLFATARLGIRGD